MANDIHNTTVAPHRADALTVIRAVREARDSLNRATPRGTPSDTLAAVFRVFDVLDDELRRLAHEAEHES